MKKHSKKHRSATQQSGIPAQEKEVYSAKVPVKIRIEHRDTVLKEYEDVIEVMFMSTTEEGRSNIANVHYLKNVKGVSTDEAIFLIASKTHEDFAKQYAATLSVAPAVELHVHIKRNGAIVYGKYTESTA